jgi:hypothetical protein
MKAKDLASLLLETPELEVTFYDGYSDTRMTIIGLCDPTDTFVELDYSDTLDYTDMEDKEEL